MTLLPQPECMTSHREHHGRFGRRHNKAESGMSVGVRVSQQ
jgi:hypothetical protein